MNMSRPRITVTPVKLARIKLGLTQGDLAEKVGVCKGYMSLMERTPAMMTAEVAARVAKVLGLRVEELSK